MIHRHFKYKKHVLIRKNLKHDGEHYEDVIRKTLQIPLLVISIYLDKSLMHFLPFDIKESELKKDVLLEWQN